MRRKASSSASQVEPTKSASNSLDWDSPSAKTGTVKRRPVSGDPFHEEREKNDYRDKTEAFEEDPRRPGRKNERRDYSRADASRDKWNKCESKQGPNRSVSVYDPSSDIRGFEGEVGQPVAARGVAGNVLGLEEFY